MKTVLFVPGFWQDLSTDDYQSTLDAIQNKGYAVKFIPIKWRRTTIDDWMEQLSAEYQKHDPSDTILAGFSYGAMTAFCVAAQRLPSELWLFSLSPYFSEDLPLLKPVWLHNIGKRRTENFSHLSFISQAQNITCKTMLFLGDKEARKFPYLTKRVLAAHKSLLNSTLIRVPDCDHDVTSAPYIAWIEKSI